MANYDNIDRDYVWMNAIIFIQIRPWHDDDYRYMWPWKGERLLKLCVQARGETDLVHLNANPVGMRLIVVGCRRSMIPTLCCCVHYCIGINRSAVNNESSGTPSHHSAAATADGNVIALIWSVGPAKRNLYVLLVLPLSAHVVCVEEEIPGHILWLYTQPTERQYSLTNIIRSHRSLGWNGTWSSFQSAVECGSVSTVDTLSPGKIQ